MLQLMSDNSAAALQFGVFRRAEFNATPNVSCGGVVVERMWLVDVLMLVCCYGNVDVLPIVLYVL